MNANTAIREIMTTKLVTVGPDAKAEEIKAIFDKQDFHHLPVVDRGEKLVGIISREDFSKVAHVLALKKKERDNGTIDPKANLVAEDMMTRYPLFLDPEDTIGLAADIFMANKFHALPIVEDEQLLGLVTTHDLLKFSFNSRTIEKEEEEFRD